MKTKTIFLVILLTFFVYLFLPASYSSSGVFSFEKNEKFFPLIFSEPVSIIDDSDKTEIKQKFLNETIKFEYGNFRPEIRKGSKSTDYFKKLNLQEDEIFTLLEFENGDDIIKNLDQKVLALVLDTDKEKCEECGSSCWKLMPNCKIPELNDENHPPPSLDSAPYNNINEEKFSVEYCEIYLKNNLQQAFYIR